LWYFTQKAEFQWHTNNRSNSFVEDSQLNIRPSLTVDDFSEHFLYSGTLDLNDDEQQQQ